MDFSHKRLFVLVSVLSILVFACAPPAYRKHPEFEVRYKNIKDPGLIPPDVKIYEFTAGGVRELRDDWCAVGRENVLKACQKCFSEKKVLIKPLAIGKESEEEMEDILALYRAVTMMIRAHAYPGPNLFPEKQKNFDYSIGPIEGVLRKCGSDSMIFVYGMEEISTGGRKALMALGMIAGALTGVYVVPRGGITLVSIAVVDSSGSIIWYNVNSAGGHDLRNPEGAAVLVRDSLSDFPSLGKLSE